MCSNFTPTSASRYLSVTVDLLVFFYDPENWCYSSGTGDSQACPVESSSVSVAIFRRGMISPSNLCVSLSEFVRVVIQIRRHQGTVQRLQGAETWNQHWKSTANVHHSLPPLCKRRVGPVAVQLYGRTRRCRIYVWVSAISCSGVVKGTYITDRM